MTSSALHGRPEVGMKPPGYRLPADTRLGPVHLQVSDLERSLNYYEGILGFSVLDRSGDRAVLGTVGGDVSIVELIEQPGVRPVPRRGLLGLFHVAYLLPSRADLARFVRHLAKRGERAGMSDHLVSEAVYLTDPDGLGIEVYADRPRSEWQYDGDQIAMATIPLNLRDLLAGDDTPWGAMPDRTVVGHVHLHVGDLDRAVEFYHKALGFDQVVWSYPGARFLSAGGYHHHLGMNTWAGDAPPAGPDDARLLEWTILVPGADDIGVVANNLEATGYSITRDGATCLTTDPWGTPLRIVPTTRTGSV